MKYLSLVLIAIFSLSILSCNKLDIEKGTPQCIKSKIKDFDKDQNCNEGVCVKEYLFQGVTVYAFDPGNCGADQTIEIIDSDCNHLGNLGGISGNTIINGEEFSSAEYQSTTWEK